jgi:hypothetical protein
MSPPLLLDACSFIDHPGSQLDQMGMTHLICVDIVELKKGEGALTVYTNKITLYMSKDTMKAAAAIVHMASLQTQRFIKEEVSQIIEEEEMEEHEAELEEEVKEEVA